MEDLPYNDMPQEPYLTPAAPLEDNLVLKSKSTFNEIHCAPSLLTFIVLQQLGTLGTLLEAVLPPKAALLLSYVEEVIPVHTKLPW